MSTTSRHDSDLAAPGPAVDVATFAATAFASIPGLISRHAAWQPGRPALIEGDNRLSWHELNERAERIAATLQREGIGAGQSIAICATNSIEYICVYLGALRNGVVVAPLSTSATADVLDTLLLDSGARCLFLDAQIAHAWPRRDTGAPAPRVALDDSDAGQPLSSWMADAGSIAATVHIAPDMPFNIVYSSGTTGVPKGIVHSHALRWAQVQRAERMMYDASAVIMLATPFYSNATLTSLFPTLAVGGTVVLMRRFDARQYLQLAQQHGATHTILVPVQYRRILDAPDFDSYDLSTFRMKQCAGAPFAAELKARALAQWPGGLIDLYGLTEGGGTCLLYVHETPHKLHTVGRPAPGHEIRLIDENGVEVEPGAAGEIVGRSPIMMAGYHNQPEKTAEIEWYDPQGRRFLRAGDVGRFDEDGFLILVDRKKDMIISGGFNIYPSDIETVLASHPDVIEASVIAATSASWGETPVAYVVCRPGAPVQADELRDWANAKLGKTQRLAAVELTDELPRSGIGKILKNELRDRYLQTFGPLP